MKVPTVLRWREDVSDDLSIDSRLPHRATHGLRGGRTASTRAAASLGMVNLDHFLPDYTAYEELLDVFKAFTSIPILLEGERGYAFTHEDLRREVQSRSLSRPPLLQPLQPHRQAARTAPPMAPSTSGATWRDCPRPSTRAWASSAPRSINGSSPCPGNSSA